MENQGSRKIFHLLFWPWLLGSFGWVSHMFFVCFAFKDILVGGCHGLELPLWEGQLGGGLSKGYKITLTSSCSFNNILPSLTQTPEMKSHLPVGQSNFHKSFPPVDEESEFPGMGV